MAVDLTLWSDLVFTAPTDSVGSTSRAVTMAVAIPAFGALVWRRCAPVAVFAILCLQSVGSALTLTYRPIVPVCVGLATIAAQRSPRIVLVAFGCAVLTSGAWIENELRTSPELTTASGVVIVGVGYLLLLAIAVGVGQWQRAHQSRVQVLERQRREAAERARTAERLRVARELHDIVAHTVTVMVLQAAGARRVMESDPQRAAVALAAVEEAGTQAMGELRRLLGVLRAGGMRSPGDESDVGSQQGLADIDSLLDTFRAAGMRVDASVAGPVGRLDPSVDLAAFRVIQEGLTNASKHAGPGANVVVRVEWSDVHLIVGVGDDGAAKAAGAQPALSTGHGLLGLRERVELVGGALQTEAVPTGGFRLTAALPIARPSAPDPMMSAEREAVEP